MRKDGAMEVSYHGCVKVQVYSGESGGMKQRNRAAGCSQRLHGAVRKVGW